MNKFNCPFCGVDIPHFNFYAQFEGNYCSSAYCESCGISYSGFDAEADGEGDEDAVDKAEESLGENLGNMKKKIDELLSKGTKQ
jgi:hypothetical protein